MLNAVIQKAITTKQLVLYANKDYIRDFIFIDDVVQAFVLAAEQKHSWDGSFWVIGSGQGYSFEYIWSYIAKRVEKLDGTAVTIKQDLAKILDLKEKRNFVADTSGFTTLTSWRPAIELHRGIDQTIEWYASTI
jgi:nucleoside-diphosphate-sugar epimerase